MHHIALPPQNSLITGKWLDQVIQIMKYYSLAIQQGHKAEAWFPYK